MKRKVSILLIITMIISMFTLSGCGVAEESADEFEHRGGLITGYNGDSEKFKIPDKIDGYLVKGIDRWAFRGRSAIKEIVIPDGVTEIGGSAFEDCESLTSITIPDSVTCIGGEAFSGCTSLKSITIPDSVTAIRYYYPYFVSYDTFKDCADITVTYKGKQYKYDEYNNDIEKDFYNAVYER